MAVTPPAPAGGLDLPWQIHAVLPASRANGPGTRYVVWVQGCTLGCPGCFNPGTHPAAVPGQGHAAVEPAGAGGGEAGTGSWRVGDLAAAVLAVAGQIEGVTLTGGEPLQQPAPAEAFCREIRARSGLSIVILTGYARREIEDDPQRSAAVAVADMVIAGRYNRGLHLGAGLRGSANKEYWALTSRHSAADFTGLPDVEILVGPGGLLTMTGLPGPGPSGPGRLPAVGGTRQAERAVSR